MQLKGLHLYVDVDDVLAETTRAIHALASSLFGHRVEFEQMVEFGLARSLQLDQEEHAQLWKAIHEAGFLESLQPLPHAVETVQSWHQAGAKISVVTGRPPESQPSTLTWLKQLEIPHDALEIIDKYGRFRGAAVPSKEDLADRDYSWVIEDSSEMAVFFSERTQAQVFLIDRPWNRKFSIESSRIKRVADWVDLKKVCSPIGPDAPKPC